MGIRSVFLSERNNKTDNKNLHFLTLFSVLCISDLVTKLGEPEVTVNDGDQISADLMQTWTGTTMSDSQPLDLTYDDKDLQGLTAGSSAKEVIGSF